MEKRIIKLNPGIYSLDVIYSSCYLLLDKCYIRLSGNIEKEILVEISLKEKGDVEKIVREFHNELLNYQFYSEQLKKTGDVREILLQRALFGNIILNNEIQQPKIETDSDDFIGDPNKIVPWED